MSKSYYTLIKIAPNSISGDKLSIGLIAFDEKITKIRFSPTRQRVAEKLIGNGKEVINYIVQQIKANLQDDSTKLQEKITVKGIDNQWIASYLDYLQKYSNGTLQFSEPRLIAEELNEIVFDNLFQTLIENNISNSNNILQNIEESFKQAEEAPDSSLSAFSFSNNEDELFLDGELNKKTFLEKAYFSLKRFEEIRFLPSDFIIQLYPFKSQDKNITTYINIFSLFTDDSNILEFFKKIEISDKGEIMYQDTEDFLEVENYVEKLEFVIQKLNNALIFNIEDINHRKKFSKNIYFPNKDCDCIVCSYSKFRFYNSVTQLQLENPSDDYQALKNAYIHYQFGNYVTAYSLYRELAERFKTKKQSITYSICLYNITKLANHIRNAHIWIDWDETQAFIEEIKKINLSQQINELNLTSKKNDLLLLIKEDKLFHNALGTITTLAREIIDSYHSSQRGGFSLNSLVYELRGKLAQIVEFITGNYLVFDNFLEFKHLIEIATEAFFASYAIKNDEDSSRQSSKLEYFDDYLLTTIIWYNEPDDLRKFIRRYQIKTIQYQTKNSHFWDYFENFIDLQNTRQNIVEKLKESKNNRFLDKHSRIFNNFLIIFANLEIEKGRFENIIIQIIDYFIQNPFFLRHLNFDGANYVFYKKEDDFNNEQLTSKVYEFLQFIIFELKEDKHYDENIIRTLVRILAKNKFLIQEQSVVNQIITTLSSKPSYLPIFYKITTPDHQIILKKQIINNLSQKFDADLYFVAVVDKVIDYQPFFKNLFELGEYSNMIKIAYKLNLDLSTEYFQQIAQKSDYYNWLINLEIFDYSKFKVEWLTQEYNTIFFNQFKNIPIIRKKIAVYLKRERNQLLEDIYFDFFIMEEDSILELEKTN